MDVQKLWNEQRPNLVFYVLSTVVISAGSAITAITHGLKWWQQVILVALYLVVVACGAVAIYVIRRRHHQLVSELPKKQTASEPQPERQNESLSQRIESLAKDLFGFLRACGEESPPSISYIVTVHSGYMRAWYHKVEDVTYELGISGYVDFELARLTGNELEAFSYTRIRDIAEHLLKIKNEMELHGLRNSTLSHKEIEQMTADELRKGFDDPKFKSDVEMLELFKQPR